MNEKDVLKKAFLMDETGLFSGKEDDLSVNAEFMNRLKKKTFKNINPRAAFLSTAAGRASASAAVLIVAFGVLMCSSEFKNAIAGLFHGEPDKKTVAPAISATGTDLINTAATVGPAAKNGTGVWKYGENGDDTLEIEGYEGSSDKVTVPSDIDGRTVKKIKKFSLSDTVKEVTIPETVTTIEKEAFAGCKSLTSVTIPKSVAAIEEKAFDGCESLEAVYYSGTVSDWANVSVDEDNDGLFSAVIRFAAHDDIKSKEEAYHRSLNTIDYFVRASGSFISELDGDVYDVTYSTDMLKRFGYQHFKDNKGNDTETFIYGGKSIRYDNVNNSCGEFQYTVIRKEDAKPVDDNRVMNGTFIYRADPTMIPQSCAALYPQVMAYGLLHNFDLWDITGNTEYAQRNCVIINGKLKSGFRGIKEFTLYIDAQTGVWLYGKGYGTGGETVYSLESTSFRTESMSEEIFAKMLESKNG